jgi:hypothetical protein
MRSVTMAMAAAAALAVIGSLTADDAADARALVERALQAAGGLDRLAKPRSYTFKQELTTRTKKAPDGVTSTATFYYQPPKKYRMEEDGRFNGKPVSYVEVINGNRGWGKRDGVVRPLAPRDVAHPLEVQQGFGYKFILVLRDSSSPPTWLGRSTIGDRPVVGIKITRRVVQALEERRLFFDPVTNLLARSELRTKLSTGGEMATEQTWDDWKMIDGVAVPHKVTHVVKDSAGTTFERTYRDFKFVDNLDPHLFDQP